MGHLAYRGQILIVVYSSLKKADFEKHLSGFFSALDQVSLYSSDMSTLSGNCLVPKTQ